MKIVFLSDDIPPHSYGGAGVIALADAAALADLGHEVSIITTIREGKEAKEEKRGKITVHTIPSNYHVRWRAYASLNNKSVVQKVDEILKEIKPDIVHAHNIHEHLSYKTLEIARRYTKKVFLTAHDVMLVNYGKFMPPANGSLKSNPFLNLKHYGFPRYNPLRNFFIKRYIKNITKIFSVSDALKDFLEANGIQNVATIHNGINYENWNKIDPNEVESLKQRLNLANKKVILFAGRLSSLKGGEVLLKVYNKIKSTMPEVRLLCVGRKVDDVSQTDIIFTGQVSREEMKNYYALATVVAVPSLCFDSFPTVVLEAMSVGRPVVATVYGGAKELVLEGQTGFIVDPRNETLLEERLIKILSDDNLADQLGKKAIERVKEFSQEKHMEELLSWYNSLSHGSS